MGTKDDAYYKRMHRHIWYMVHHGYRRIWRLRGLEAAEVFLARYNMFPWVTLVSVKTPPNTSTNRGLNMTEGQSPAAIVLCAQDKERLRQAVNLIAYVRNDVSAMDHPNNLPEDVKQGLQKLQEAETLLNRAGAKAKLYGVDVPFPHPV